MLEHERDAIATDRDNLRRQIEDGADLIGTLGERTGQLEAANEVIAELRAALRAERADRGPTGTIMVTEDAAALIVRIRGLYAKDGTDAELLGTALEEIRSQRRLLREWEGRAQEGHQQAVRLTEEKERLRVRVGELSDETTALERDLAAMTEEAGRLRDVIEGIARGVEPVHCVLAQDEEERVWREALNAAFAGGAGPAADQYAAHAVERWRERYRDSEQTGAYAELAAFHERSRRPDETREEWLMRRGWRRTTDPAFPWELNEPEGVVLATSDTDGAVRAQAERDGREILNVA